MPHSTLAYSRYGRANNQLWNLSVTVILIANLVVLFRLTLLAAAVSPRLLAGMAMVLGGGLLPRLVAIVIWMWTGRDESGLTIPEVRNSTELRTARTFCALYAVVLLLAAWLNDVAGSSGVYAVALISGLTGVDAVTLSSLRMHEIGSLSAEHSITSIVLAVFSSMALKLGLILVAGSRDCPVPAGNAGSRCRPWRGLGHVLLIGHPAQSGATRMSNAPTVVGDGFVGLT